MADCAGCGQALEGNPDLPCAACGDPQGLFRTLQLGMIGLVLLLFAALWLYKTPFASTGAPASAKRSAMCFPIPVPPPVMIVTLSLTEYASGIIESSISRNSRGRSG